MHWGKMSQLSTHWARISLLAMFYHYVSIMLSSAIDLNDTIEWFYFLLSLYKMHRNWIRKWFTQWMRQDGTFFAMISWVSECSSSWHLIKPIHATCCAIQPNLFEFDINSCAYLTHTVPDMVPNSFRHHLHLCRSTCHKMYWALDEGK